MTPEQRVQLVEAALQARRHAYASYSQFAVGAALRADNGEIFVGCNVENASYGLTICAERAAVASAVVAGQCRFTALVIATAGGVTPCGACRQVLAEFCEDLPILLVDVDHGNAVSEVQLARLLPNRFTNQSTGNRDS